jgi:hypothetical protein
MGRHEMKRQGLVPFPRVGRSGNGLNPRFYQKYSDYNKRGMQSNPAAASQLLWFGPRLGKRSTQGEQN